MSYSEAAKAILERIKTYANRTPEATKAAIEASASNLERGSMGSWRRAEAGAMPKRQSQQNMAAQQGTSQGQGEQQQMNQVGQMMGQKKAEDEGSGAHARAMATFGFGMGVRGKRNIQTYQGREESPIFRRRR